MNLTNDKNEIAQLTIIDAGGRVVINKPQTLVTGDNNINVTLTGNMANGLYLLKINTGTQVYTARFIKAAR